MSEEIIQLENRISRKYRDRHTKENNEKNYKQSTGQRRNQNENQKYLERKDKKCKIIKACKTQQKPS